MTQRHQSCFERSKRSLKASLQNIHLCILACCKYACDLATSSRIHLASEFECGTSRASVQSGDFATKILLWTQNLNLKCTSCPDGSHNSILIFTVPKIYVSSILCITISIPRKIFQSWTLTIHVSL